MPGCWRYWPGNGQGAGLKVREGENRPGSAPHSPGDLLQVFSLPTCVGMWAGADVALALPVGPWEPRLEARAPEPRARKEFFPWPRCFEMFSLLHHDFVIFVFPLYHLCYYLPNVF